MRRAGAAFLESLDEERAHFVLEMRDVISLYIFDNIVKNVEVVERSINLRRILFKVFN